MLMIKFSAGYSHINPNFVIQNINATTKNRNPIFSILSNILQRGCPTIPSQYLRENFGNLATKKIEHNLNFNNCEWDYVIKGGDSNNPALDFYKNTLPKFLGENAKTFVPELPLTDIVEYPDQTIPISEKVDFYSPLYNTVIEIDGSQHQSDSEQNLKDIARDEVLKTNHIKILRFKTEDLDNLHLIKQELDQLTINEKYRKNLHRYKSIDDCNLNYMVAIRMELLLLSLYENNYINLDDELIKLNILSYDKIGKEIFETSVNDFMLWLENICCLHNYEFKTPKIEIDLVENEILLSHQKGINIAISLKDVYSQTKLNDIIYIKNDFFLYEDNLVPEKKDNEPSSYLYKKNYFVMKTQKVNYKLTKEKHEQALEFILKNSSSIYENFRANQLDIILECLNNTSVIGVLPTGAGKSLCYQLTSLLIPSMTLMIAPLQLLMVDQYNNIKEKFGMTNVAYINSTNKSSLDIFARCKSLITIISPERFFSEKFLNSLSKRSINVGFIVIDEAHCLSEWGHDFRTSYLCLSHNLSNYLPSSTFLMALTGTASHRVFEDINNEFLNFKKKKTNAIFAENMRRDNLTIVIQRTDDIYKELIDNISPTFFGINKDKTLVFTKTKKPFKTPTDSACISLVEKIKTEYGVDKELISHYAGNEQTFNMENAKRNNKEKEQTLNDFKNGKIMIMFATKAFGMGVDIPDIRKTIHYGLPSSFESLYQQFGRAGRDGKPSKCYVYYKPENPIALKRSFQLPPISVSEINQYLDELNELNTNFYFIQSSNLDEDIEFKLIKRLLQGIKTRNRLKKDYVEMKTIENGPFKEINDKHLNDLKKNSSQMIIEKALYRLYLLGEIEMWTLIYTKDLSNTIFNHLQLTSLTEKEKLQRLTSHIEKYQSNFKFEFPNTFENRLKFLIKWSNENYLQERIQTMKTLYEQCEYFTNSDTFMNYISNYFSNDPLYVRLINRNITLNDWIEPLEAHPVETKARIARLLESYDKIIPLNYVSGITRLRLDDFSNTDGERRLNLAMESVSEFNQDDRMYLFKNTYSLLTKQQKQLFIKTWLTYCKNDAKIIYETTDDPTCQDYLVVNFANELIKIGEMIDDRL